MEHTALAPKCWHYSGGSIYARIGADGYGESCIAHMDRDNPETSPAERDANARLAAAAPTMHGELIRSHILLVRLMEEVGAVGASHLGEAVRLGIDHVRGALSKANADA